MYSYIDYAQEMVVGELILNAITLTAMARILVKALHVNATNRNVIVDVNTLKTNGVPEKIAKKCVKNTIMFLIDNGYTNVNPDVEMIRYKDLTSSGKQFMMGYYSEIGKIDTFTVEKAIASKKTAIEKRLNVAKITFDIIFDIGLIIIGAVVGVCLTKEYLPIVVGMCIQTVCNFLYNFILMAHRKKYKTSITMKGNDYTYDELNEVLEDAYDDGYYQALADMGYEFDDEASEDVDIFDDNYYDIYDQTADMVNKARKSQLGRKDHVTTWL